MLERSAGGFVQMFLRTAVTTSILLLLGCSYLIAQSRDWGYVRGSRGLASEDPQQKIRDPYRKKVALVVGIDLYENGVPPLRYAARDAQAVHDLLRDLLAFDKVVLLKNEKAKKHHILHQIIRLRDETHLEDQFFFFFAGHGVSFGEGDHEIGYLLPQDAHGVDQESAWVSGISMSDLREHLVKLPPKHVLVSIDACFGGYAAFVSRGRPELTGILGKHPARQILTAGSRGQVVYEGADWQHSAFTYKFLQGLGERFADLNGDGIVPTTELYSYLQGAVTALTRGTQTPQYAILRHGEGEFIFLLPPYPDDSAQGESGIGQTPNDAQRAYAYDFPPFHTREGLQRKVIISRRRASLFADFRGMEGIDAPYLQVYFLHRGSKNGRVPVALGPRNNGPDGWLRVGSFMEWDTNRVFTFEYFGESPIFETQDCANDFARTGEVDGCKTLTGKPPLSTLPGSGGFVPVLEGDEVVYKGGFVVPGNGRGLWSESRPDEMEAKSAYALIEGRGVRRSGETQIAEGWVPRQVRGRSVLAEYALMDQVEAMRLRNAVELIHLAVQDGALGGAEAFLDTLKDTLATTRNLNPGEILPPGVRLGSSLKQHGILPFEGTLLSFATDDVYSWGRDDFQRLSERLGEKVQDLRSFLSNSDNTHVIGDRLHVFLPRVLIP